MLKGPRIAIQLALAALAIVLIGCAGMSPQRTSVVERLYVLDCGEGTAIDVSRWTPGVDIGKPAAFVDNCYLIKHAQGWLLWDTGVDDAVAKLPDGAVPADPKSILWRRPRTLASQLEQLGVKPSDIRYVAISHTHPDHIGNVEMFPQAVLLVQRAEYEWPGAGNAPRFKPGHPVTLLDGDRDVFGDGSVTILSTPGHTPGHQSLLVNLPKTGAVVLTGDAVHFRSNWDQRRVPSINFSKELTLSSMQRIADLMARDNAQLWINHDKDQRNTMKMAPAYYE
ncbi:N-acyl homoserine lactonase family protein [Cupriavidus sp. WKF15]|uniref:N-acyl homoserine lactonase family protein n=1 Tax=Cupriavidus sp. WKF15 TaxID=3032282 RepID=UPI0023E0C1DC|nr:N-acyl homoserine lactonase family protein [Cupriavidus sp. WKF15]WER48800.1 N-acyl homoserine lactonase family protein [Cupriavidus sp. WKF15]